ncbi:MAG: ROK family protein [Akkermansiaceae bacterium]|nr:ROK family protein [Akkermansiaceae bacterium]
MAENNAYFAGLDVGGTTIKSALVDSHGDPAGDMVEVRSRVKEGFEATFGQLEKALDARGRRRHRARRHPRIGLRRLPLSCDGVIWGRANSPTTGSAATFATACLPRRRAGLHDQRRKLPPLGECAIRRKHLGGCCSSRWGRAWAADGDARRPRLGRGQRPARSRLAITVPFREEDGELPECSCGWKGCVEASVSSSPCVAGWHIELSKRRLGGTSANQGDDPVEEKALPLRDFAEKGESAGDRDFPRTGMILGYAPADLVRVFDPGPVVIGGAWRRRNSATATDRSPRIRTAPGLVSAQPADPGKETTASNGPRAVTPPPRSGWPTRRARCFR